MSSLDFEIFEKYFAAPSFSFLIFVKHTSINSSTVFNVAAIDPFKFSEEERLEAVDNRGSGGKELEMDVVTEGLEFVIGEMGKADMGIVEIDVQIELLSVDVIGIDEENWGIE